MIILGKPWANFAVCLWITLLQRLFRVWDTWAWIREQSADSLSAFNECSLLSTDCAKWIWFQFQILLFSWTLTCSLISIFNLKNGPELWHPPHSHWYLDEKLWSDQWEVRSRTATGLPNSFFSDFFQKFNWLWVVSKGLFSYIHTVLTSEVLSSWLACWPYTLRALEGMAILVNKY